MLLVYQAALRGRGRGRTGLPGSTEGEGEG